MACDGVLIGQPLSSDGKPADPPQYGETLIGWTLTTKTTKQQNDRPYSCQQYEARYLIDKDETRIEPNWRIV